MSKNTFAVFYHPDAYDVKTHQLMGRRAAGQSFLNAWIDRNGDDVLYCHAGNKQQFADFCEIAKARGASGQAVWVRRADLEPLKKIGALYFPGPDISFHTWQRYKRAPNAWSLIGITHTLCTKTIMDDISQWATAPVEPWDAVICTSRAARESIQYQMAAQREHLVRRVGATKFTDPQLPIIPLGIHTDDFAPDEELRAKTRALWNIGADEIAVLYVGRLARYSKAHPAPMLIALQRAAARTGVKVRLVMAGQFPSPAGEAALIRDAANWAPNIALRIVDGRDDQLCAGAWRAADIFISLADNIQETFGLTPVEAMAAGLPAIVSDWDGYRDSIRDGTDGFRIPTMIPPAVLGESAMDRYVTNADSYDNYVANSASMVVVDVEAAAAALATLLADKTLRQRMGAAGRARAVAHYDWRIVLNAYQDLLDDLAERRGAMPASEVSGPRRWPARLSPFEMFGNYATRTLRGQDQVRLHAGASPDIIAYIASAERAVIKDSPLFISSSQRLLKAMRDPITVSELVQDEPGEAKGVLLGTLLILAKFGVISITRATP